MSLKNRSVFTSGSCMRPSELKDTKKPSKAEGEMWICHYELPMPHYTWPADLEVLHYIFITSTLDGIDGVQSHSSRKETSLYSHFKGLVKLESLKH